MSESSYFLQANNNIYDCYQRYNNSITCYPTNSPPLGKTRLQLSSVGPAASGSGAYFSCYPEGTNYACYDQTQAMNQALYLLALFFLILVLLILLAAETLWATTSDDGDTEGLDAVCTILAALLFIILLYSFLLL